MKTTLLTTYWYLSDTRFVLNLCTTFSPLHTYSCRANWSVSVYTESQTSHHNYLSNISWQHFLSSVDLFMTHSWIDLDILSVNIWFFQHSAMYSLPTGSSPIHRQLTFVLFSNCSKQSSLTSHFCLRTLSVHLRPILITIHSLSTHSLLMIESLLISFLLIYSTLTWFYLDSCSANFDSLQTQSSFSNVSI